MAEYAGSRLYCAQAALSEEAEVAALFQSASCQFGPVQIIVVNHGYWNPVNTRLIDMPLERWQSTMDSNLTSAFLVSREYLRQLSGASESVIDGASIVFVGSTAGMFGERDHGDYATAKSGTFRIALSRFHVSNSSNHSGHAGSNIDTQE